MPFEEIIIAVAVLLILGVLASAVSSRLGIPALLLFLCIGMLAGSEGLGGIAFDNAALAQSTGVLALALILFAGGLDTDRRALAKVLWMGISLATVGVLVTAVVVAGFTVWLLDLTWTEGLLMGAIVSSTDAAAVFSVLRSQKIMLRPRIQALLELESGSNDPMAVFLTTAFITRVQNPDEPVFHLVWTFVLQMTVGALFGYLFGKLSLWALKKLPLHTEGLNSVFTLACVLLTYGVTAALDGSGFLAVYLAGLIIGNQQMPHSRGIIIFHESIAWLMQIVMFLVLGLQVFPSRMLAVSGVSILIAAVLIFIARPASVFLSTMFAKLTTRQKIFLSWGGLRGAVPIVLATFPMLAGVSRAELYFNIVFFVVLLSVLLQGTTLRWAATRLGLVPTAESTESLVRDA